MRQGDQPAAGVRAAVRQRPARTNGRGPRQARAVRQEHPRLRRRRTPSSLHRQLGVSDQRKLDEYLSARPRDRAADRAGRAARARRTDAGRSSPPDGVPGDYDEHIRLMGDLLVLAFQTDRPRDLHVRASPTRAATAATASSTSAKGTTTCRTTAATRRSRRRSRKINHFHMEQFAYLLGKLKAIKEGDGTLLDNCDDRLRQRHRRRQPPQPRRPAGAPGRPRQRHAQHRPPRDVQGGTPLTNLYLSLLDRMGCKVEKLGDSNGRIDKLKADCGPHSHHVGPDATVSSIRSVISRTPPAAAWAGHLRRRRWHRARSRRRQRARRSDVSGRGPRCADSFHGRDAGSLSPRICPVATA